MEKIKKKMSVTITELEMSLDAANKANNGLQNAGKAQATKIMELTSILEKTNQKLVMATEAADGNAKRLAAADQVILNLQYGQSVDSFAVQNRMVVECV